MEQTFYPQPPMAGPVPKGVAEIRRPANRAENQIIPNQNELNPA